MARKFRTLDYDATLNLEVKVSDWLPPHHLARFVVMVIGLLDLTAIYSQYALSPVTERQASETRDAGGAPRS
jgi:hypothetical protein